MTREEADFISKASTLADTGVFASVSDLHAVLRTLWLKSASNWMTDDVWQLLARRCEVARLRRVRHRP